VDVFAGNGIVRCSRVDLDTSTLERVSTCKFPDDQNTKSSRYAFPQEPVMDGDMIDLTADEKLFYFNPYSGELKLDFPKAERNCKGGILA